MNLDFKLPGSEVLSDLNFIKILQMHIYLSIKKLYVY